MSQLNENIKKLTKDSIERSISTYNKKNFVVRKSWMGRNQIITFTNNKNHRITYNHDEVLKVMLPKLNILPCWIKRGYWSQSTDMPKNVRKIVLERVKLS